MNSAEKSLNSFHSYQEQKQTKREEIIRNWLNTARETRSRYTYVTDLAKSVALHITQAEKQNCNHATLLRNKRYKALLLSYMAESVSRIKGGKVPIGDKHSVAQLTLIFSQLETTNVRQENKRLKAYITELENEASVSKSRSEVAGIAKQSIGGNQAEHLADLMKKYIHTCQTLLLVLERRRDVLEINEDKKQIIDSSMLRGDKIIVDASLAEAFFDWYKANQAIR